MTADGESDGDGEGATAADPTGDAGGGATLGASAQAASAVATRKLVTRERRRWIRIIPAFPSRGGRRDVNVEMRWIGTQRATKRSRALAAQMDPSLAIAGGVTRMEPSGVSRLTSGEPHDAGRQHPFDLGEAGEDESVHPRVERIHLRGSEVAAADARSSDRAARS